MSSNKERPHYIPACLIGGFGAPDTGKHANELRYAWVCSRRRDMPQKVTPRIRADNLAVQNGLYDVDQPCSALPADFAEQLWRAYEGPLPQAISALEAGTYNQHDWLTVLLHIQAQSIRHPDFSRNIEPDRVQPLRQLVHRISRPGLARSRFALVRRGRGARRFLINDKGYVVLGRPGFRGYLFPLSGSISVLMVDGAAQPGDDYERGPFAERILNPAGMRIINAATWGHGGIRCVMGHPDDAGWIGALEAGGTYHLPRFGPYQGNRESGMFNWSILPR